MCSPSILMGRHRTREPPDDPGGTIRTSPMLVAAFLLAAVVIAAASLAAAPMSRSSALFLAVAFVLRTIADCAPVFSICARLANTTNQPLRVSTESDIKALAESAETAERVWCTKASHISRAARIACNCPTSWSVTANNSLRLEVRLESERYGSLEPSAHRAVGPVDFGVPV